MLREPTELQERAAISQTRHELRCDCLVSLKRSMVKSVDGPEQLDQLSETLAHLRGTGPARSTVALAECILEVENLQRVPVAHQHLQEGKSGFRLKRGSAHLLVCGVRFLASTLWLWCCATSSCGFRRRAMRLLAPLWITPSHQHRFLDWHDSHRSRLQELLELRWKIFEVTSVTLRHCVKKFQRSSSIQSRRLVSHTRSCSPYQTTPCCGCGCTWLVASWQSGFDR